MFDVGRKVFWRGKIKQVKTALVGSSGYIAKYIEKRFSEEQDIDLILKIDRSDRADQYLDLADVEKFNFDILDDIDYVVFTAAVSEPDQCAKDFDNCWNINVIGTIIFIKEAIKHNCRVLFFSSDAVFGDDSLITYTEESLTDAHTPYGRMKKAVEDEFAKESLFKAIRLSYVVSAKDRFVSYCLNCINNNEIADIYHPFYRNAISVSDVVDVVTYFAFHWKDYSPTFFNVAGKELISRIRIADELNMLLGERLKYSVSTPGGGFFANRPMITRMNSIYNHKYKIVTDNSFSEKFENEMKGIEI